MDIQYLIFLQGLRESLGDSSVKFFELISFIPKSPLSVLIPGILFWCVNKRAGIFLMFLETFGQIVNQLVKNTFCVYRPWIFNEELLPVQKDMLKASSYSFPSSHTNMAAALYGGLAYFYRKNFSLLIIPCVLIVLLVALSRNFLGVHTPQDVLFAIFEISIMVIFAEKIFTVLESNIRLSNLAFIAGMIFCIAATLYIFLKPYPVDYLNGEVIVDTEKVLLDSVDKIGCFLGFLLGAFFERRMINFKTKAAVSTKIHRAIIGCAVGGIMFVFLYLIKLTGFEMFYEFCKGFIPFFSVIFLAPLAFNFAEKKHLL